MNSLGMRDYLFHAKNGIAIHAFSLQAYCDRHLWKGGDKMPKIFVWQFFTQSRH